MGNKDEVAIGIDLGTTYSCVAVQVNGVVKIIPNDVGKDTTPSYVTINEEGDFYAGEISKSLAHENPERTIYDVKRLIGRTMYDTYVRGDMKLWPFQVTHENCSIKIEIDDETSFYPEEISARVLSFLKGTAEDYLGFGIDKCVITVPAYFNDHQIEATRTAGKMAGLQVLKIVQEPTAAAIAYNHLESLQPDNENSGDKGPRNCLIFDLGGGTFDVAILVMDKGKIEIKAADGHHHIGGEDFDNAMVNYCTNHFKKMYGIDLNEEKYDSNEVTKKRAVKALRRLKAECEKEKVFLSCIKKVDVSLSALYDGKDIHVPFDQALFNQLNDDKFKQCMEIVERAIKSSKIPKEKITHIVLVGGSSRIPRVQELLSKLLGGKQLFKQIDPETAVAYGASIEAAALITGDDSGTLKPVPGPFPIVRTIAMSNKESEREREDDFVILDNEKFKTESKNEKSINDGDEKGPAVTTMRPGKKNSKGFLTLLPKSIRNPFDLVSKVRKEESQRRKELKQRENEERAQQQ